MPQCLSGSDATVRQDRLVCRKLLPLYARDKRVDRVRSKKVLDTVGQIILSMYVKRRQLQWLGYTLRAPEDNLT